MKGFLILLIALPSAAIAGPRFADRSDGLPIQHVYTGGWEHFVGGGVAVFDCNGDSRPDFLAAGGEAPASLFVNTTSGPSAPLTFSAGRIEPILGTTGAYPLEIDGDGEVDLVILRVGRNELLKGDGACGFASMSDDLGFQGGDRWSTAFSATWEPGQSLPTLAIGNYVDRSDPEGPFEACDVNELHRPTDGSYGQPIELDPGYCALSMLISDWQRTGSPELRISNDRHYYVRGGYEEMWRLDPLRPRDETDGWRKVSLWGMGIASGDVDGNGYPDVMMTSMGDQLLQLNDGRDLTNVPYAFGTYAQRPHLGDDGRPSTGWHAEFGDVDNDGLPDLFIAKGNVDQMPSNAIADPNNLLMQVADGTFVEASVEAGIATTARSRGAAFSDFDGDGRLDLVVVNRRAPLELWQNVTDQTGNWLDIELRQDAPNTRGIGAWIEIVANNRTQVRELTSGGGHVGGSLGPVHFGLGDANEAHIRVKWPGADWSDAGTYSAGQHILIRR